MGLFNKIKNILFDEEETEIPVIVKERKEDPREEEKEDKRSYYSDYQNNFDDEEETDEDDESTKEVQTALEQEKKSPFINFDEDEFEKIKFKTTRTTSNVKIETKKDGSKSINYNKYEVKEESSNKKAFKVSPMISPVYGIMDKNYVKEDFLPKFKEDPKKPTSNLNVDSVRNKAFGTLEDAIESSICLPEDESYDDEPKPGRTIDELLMETIEEEQPIEEAIVESQKNDFLIEDAIENDNFEYELEEIAEDADDPKEKKLEQTSALEILDEIEKQLDSIKENKNRLEEDTLENDLFELIDSMYEERKDGAK